MSEVASELSMVAGEPALKAIVAAAAEGLIRELEGREYKIGVFAGEDGEIELLVVMPSETKTLELAFGPDYVRPSLITATTLRELPALTRPFDFRTYAEWLISA